MFEKFKEWLKRRAARKERAKQPRPVDPGDALRQAQDNTWSGMATDARRNHPGMGSAPNGTGRR